MIDSKAVSETRITLKQTKAYLRRNDGSLLFRTLLPAKYAIIGHQDGKYFVCDESSLWMKASWVIAFADTISEESTDPGMDPDPGTEPAVFEIIDATVRYRESPGGEIKSALMVVKDDGMDADA